MGKRYDKKLLILDECGNYRMINDLTEDDVNKYLQIKPFPNIDNNSYTLQDIKNDTKCIDVWTIPKDTPKEVIKWIEGLFEFSEEEVKIVMCNVIYESIEWKLLEYVED